MINSKVVIKINYDKDRRSTSLPQNVTVWHYGRIAAALAISVLLFTIISILFANNSEKNNKQLLTDPANESQTIINDEKQIATSDPAAFQTNLIQQNIKKSESDNRNLRINSAIIFDKRVIRASLNTELKDNEPFKQVITPLFISKEQNIEVFYFNQLKNIKDKFLFHYWLKNGKNFLKKQLAIKTPSTKVVSKKNLGATDTGNWQIQLQDRNGKIYCQVDFVIGTE